MDCKKCGFFRELSPSEITKDKDTGDAMKYLCMKNNRHYTEQQLIQQEKNRRFCPLKWENRIGLFLSIASIAITILFGIFGLLPILITKYQTKNDVINTINESVKNQELYLKGDTLFISGSNSFVVIDSLFISKRLK